MCFALVTVRYRNDKSNETIRVEKSGDLAAKIEEIKNRTEATAISVYRCEQRITLTAQWVASPYTEPTPEVAA